MSVTAPKNENKREPVSIIAVLDVSGSMDCEATQGGNLESDGFSRLDLVKHSVNTIIQSLTKDDVFGIVTFSDHATLDFSPALMDEKGKNNATTINNSLVTKGSTNLWEGIKLGL